MSSPLCVAQAVEAEEQRVEAERRAERGERSKKELTEAWKAKLKRDREAAEAKEKAALKGFVSRPPPPALGATCRVEGLERARHYNDRKAVVVADRVRDPERVAVQFFLEDGPGGADDVVAGPVVLVKQANLASLPLAPRVPHAALLDGRAHRLLSDPKTKGELWVGDCLSGAVATRDGASRIDRRSLHTCAPDLRKAHAWTGATRFLCCAKELCRGLADAATRAEVPLRDAHSEDASAKWGAGLAFAAKALDAGESLLVYCTDGRSRAAAVALAVCLHRGLSLADALAKLPRGAEPPLLAHVVALVALENELAGAVTRKTSWDAADVAAFLEKQPDKRDLVDLVLGAQE